MKIETDKEQSTTELLNSSIGGGTVSVIVPVYKVEPYLRKCVDSILAQTYTNLEIILIDDGSPDNCGAICDEYAKKDKRVKVIHKANGGLSDARNAGLDIVSGDYIGFVDSDDYIEPDMYELLLGALIRTESDIACCGFSKVLEDGSSVGTELAVDNEKIYTQNDAICNMLMDNLFVVTWNKLYKSTIFEHIRFPTGKLYEDNITTCRAFSQCNRIVQIGGSTKYNYLSRSDSIIHLPFSDKTFDKFYQGEAVWNFVRNKYSELNEESDYYLWKVTLSLLRSINGLNNADGFCRKQMNAILQKWAWRLNTCKLLSVKQRFAFLKAFIKYSIESRD